MFKKIVLFICLFSLCLCFPGCSVVEKKREVRFTSVSDVPLTHGDKKINFPLTLAEFESLGYTFPELKEKQLAKNERQSVEAKDEDGNVVLLSITGNVLSEDNIFEAQITGMSSMTGDSVFINDFGMYTELQTVNEMLGEGTILYQQNKSSKKGIVNMNYNFDDGYISFTFTDGVMTYFSIESSPPKIDIQ